MNLRFFIPGHPPTANERLHHLALARERKTFRGTTKLLALNARNRYNVAYPFGPVRISFHFVFKTYRKRDLDNLIGSVKPIIDGIVDAGIITDDSLDHVQEIKATARVDKAVGDEIVVNIEELAAA